MKLKLKVGNDEVKAFFVQHVEKIVLGVTGLMLVILFCTGYVVEGIDSKKTPTSLQELAKQCASRIDNPAVPLPLEDVPQLDHQTRVRDSITLTDPTQYAIAPLLKQTIRPPQKREDPEMLAPIKPEVYAREVFLAMQPGPGDVDMLRTASQDSGRGGRAAASDDEDASSLLSGYAGGGGGSFASSGSSSGSGRQLSSSFVESLGGVNPPRDSVAKGYFLVSVLALAPYEKQWQEFERALGATDESRDRPAYVYLWVERQDVTDPDNPGPWTKTKYNYNELVGSRDRSGFMGKWAMFGPEVIDPLYFDPMITMAVPPIVYRRIDELVAHSDVPLQSASAGTEVDDEDKADTEGSDEGAPDVPGGDVPGSVVPPSGGRPASGYGTGPRGNSGSSSGPNSGSYPPSSRSGSTGPSSGSYAPGSSSSGGPGSSSGSPGSSSGYGGASSGYGGASSGYGGASSGYGGASSGYSSGAGGGYGGGSGTGSIRGNVAGPLVPYKMVRFYDLFDEDDLKALGGHKFQYRVRLAVQDPNNPRRDAGFSPPPDAMLTNDVLLRLKALKNRDSVFYRETEWSEPSDPITVMSSAHRVLAGTVKPAKEVVMRGDNQRVWIGEPTGTVGTVFFDLARAVDAATTQEVYRGSLLNFTKQIEVLGPVSREFVTLKDYEFRTNVLVLDMRGGEPLSTDSKAPKNLVAPGEFLLMDENGNLVVQNEFEDDSSYRAALFIDDTAPPPSAPTTQSPTSDGGFEQYSPRGSADSGKGGGRGGRSSSGSPKGGYNPRSSGGGASGSSSSSPQSYGPG